ncbi:MAG: hypothetical protein JXA06_13105 [Bacteroidetes bacterium]|nr:hypothetical protein [Bacteroidota bacterium]
MMLNQTKPGVNHLKQRKRKIFMKQLFILFFILCSIVNAQENNPKRVMQPAHSAAELDSLWADFFDNRTSESFIRIFKSLHFHRERQDIEVFLVGSAAKYSLINYGKQSDYILKVIRAVTEVSNYSLKPEGLDVLKYINDPDGINNYRKEVSKILAEIAGNNSN